MDHSGTPSGLCQVGASDRLIDDFGLKIFNHLFHPRRVVGASGEVLGEVMSHFGRCSCKIHKMVIVDKYAGVWARYFSPVLPRRRPPCEVNSRLRSMKPDGQINRLFNAASILHFCGDG